MKKDFDKASTDKQRLNVIGAMQGVERQLAVLAPAPAGSGSGSFKKDKRARDTADSFFSTLLIDVMLTGGVGQVFNTSAAMNAPSWMSQESLIDAVDTAEMADVAWMDRRVGQTDGFKLGERGTMAGAFNRCMYDPFCNVAKLREQAGWNDLGRRRELEGAYMGLSRKLDELGSYQPQSWKDRRNQPQLL